jgi:anti-anti-sigma factor
VQAGADEHASRDAPRLAVRTGSEAGVTVIEAVGDLEVKTAAALERALQPVVASGLDLVLDLSAVTFMDSTGLRALVGAWRDLTEGGRVLVTVVRPDSQVEALLEFTDVRQKLDIASSRAEAIARVESRD